MDTICPRRKSILENFNILALSPFDNAVFIFSSFYICRWFTVWPIGKFIFLNLSGAIVQWVTYRNIFLLIYHCRSINAWYHEKTFYKIILYLLYHTHCVMFKFFQFDFNNPAVNTFFTATKIFLQSRFINGWYIGKLFCSFILSISLYHHLVKRKRFLQENYIIFVTHPLCDTRKLF